MKIEKNISSLIMEQFPSFYKEEGFDFMLFVKTYYEFLEENNKARYLFEYGDIDETLDEYVEYFIKKYMNGVPQNVLGDKRFLEKHITDLYKSKGSYEGLKLLFRLLYNEEIDIYIPSYDILKASDGKWIIKRFIEVEHNVNNTNYDGKIIFGSSSGATALVEKYEKRRINGKFVHLLYVSNISGTFHVGEYLLTSDITRNDATKILGSPTSFTIINNSGSLNSKIGDVYIANSGSGGGFETQVTEVDEYVRGFLDFTLIDGGYGYSLDTVVRIEPPYDYALINPYANTLLSNTNFGGANTSDPFYDVNIDAIISNAIIPSTDENLQGQAKFIVTEISNTSLFEYNTTIIGNYTTVPLNANNYGGTDITDPLYGANTSTTIGDYITFQTVEVGTITKIRVINPGANYTKNPVVILIDPYTSSRMIPDGEGSYWGRDALVSSKLYFGEGIVTDMKIISTGMGYNNEEVINLVNTRDANLNVDVQLYLGDIGNEPGFWEGTSGFLNEDKYIEDSYFYQEYSYQIKSSKTLDKYIKVLKQIMHPVGNEVFGRTLLKTNKNNKTEIISRIK